MGLRGPKRETFTPAQGAISDFPILEQKGLSTPGAAALGCGQGEGVGGR